MEQPIKYIKNEKAITTRDLIPEGEQMSRDQLNKFVEKIKAKQAARDAKEPEAKKAK